MNYKVEEWHFHVSIYKHVLPFLPVFILSAVEISRARMWKVLVLWSVAYVPMNARWLCFLSIKKLTASFSSISVDCTRQWLPWTHFFYILPEPILAHKAETHLFHSPPSFDAALQCGYWLFCPSCKVLLKISLGQSCFLTPVGFYLTASCMSLCVDSWSTCPKYIQHFPLIQVETKCWLLIFQISPLVMKFFQPVPGILCRHLFLKASSFLSPALKAIY